MTGAEALQKILETVDALSATVNELKTSVQLIEQNIKVLNNRAGGLMRQQVGVVTNPISVTVPGPISNVTSAGPGAISAGVPNQKPQQTLQAGPARGRAMTETPQEVRDEPQSFNREANDGSNVLTYKKVYGRLINNTEEPIESVLIKIYDKNNEVCASTETDPIGYWETMLKPGRYVAEYTKTGFKTANKTFEVGKGAKEVEVK